ncbi:DUF2326 domain-containing protein [Burkholderia sp. S171]|uniref:DUF2326 domain-containing protein n=1 Tax=Burkholderia sp. S171 TaxID=1641860 RepID=UPI00131B44D1|nr:DUF2326 domain-containing protein [Burkholderia sp. S171]
MNAALAEIDEQISARLKNYDNPTALIDRVTMLSEQWTKLRRQNEYFEKKIAIDGDYGLLSEELSKLKTQIVYEIQGSINAKIHEIVERVYGENAKSPSLELGESSYSYQIVDDTGTGKAFANLVIFDLAIFELTDLPILIHDSPLFKNVENRAVARFIKEYERFSSQTFIALDEVYKYGEETAATLQRLSVVRLNNTGLLYVKDWRKQ